MVTNLVGGYLGARVGLKLGELDLMPLDSHGTVVDRLDADATDADTESPEDDDEVAGPIAIAVDVSDTPDTTSDNPAP